MVSFYKKILSPKVELSNNNFNLRFNQLIIDDFDKASNSFLFKFVRLVLLNFMMSEGIIQNN